MASESPLPLVLIADNDAGDLLCLRSRLDQIGVKNPVVTFNDGDQLIAFLRAMNGSRTSEKSLRPAVLFLALDLPGNAAFEALKWIAGDAGLRGLQIVVLTDRFDVRRGRRAIDLGVVRFVGKRPSVESVEKISRMAGLLVRPTS